MSTNKPSIDPEILIEHFSKNSAKQGEALRQAVEKATLAALQSREMTVKSIKDVLKAVAKTTSAVASKSGVAAPDMEPLLAKAVEGMDAALVQAVEAQRRALQQVIDQGAKLRDTQLKKVVADIEKLENTFFDTLTKATASSAAGADTLPWAQALAGVKQKGSATGSSATAAVEQLTQRARDAARQGRALGQQAAEAWMSHYAALANGVLIGMSGALAVEGGGAAPATGRARAKR